jgi:hypothetical protein
MVAIPAHVVVLVLTPVFFVVVLSLGGGMLN